MALRRGRVFDAFGGEYEASYVTFGKDGNAYSVNKQLLQNVPIRGTLKFDDVPTDIIQLTAIQVVYSLQLGSTWRGMPSATNFVRFDNISVGDAE